MQVCTSLQTDNHARTPPLCFLQAGCPSCRPTYSAKALKAIHNYNKIDTIIHFEGFMQFFLMTNGITFQISGNAVMVTIISSCNEHTPGFLPPAAATWHLPHFAASASEVSRPAKLN